MIDRRVTVMCNTVRTTDPERENRDVLLCLLDDLRRQTMPPDEFEFVAVDGIHAWREDELASEFANAPFRVRHIPPRPTAMVVAGRTAISAYKNSGIAYARGELVVCVDDHCHLDPDYLMRSWRAWNDDGVMLAALSTLGPERRMNDSRVGLLDKSGRCVGPVGGNFENPPQYGFCSVPLSGILKVNGWDEYFDGAQGLEDFDFGVRLQRAGYRVALRREHVVRLGHVSTPWDPRAFGGARPDVIKCCQTTLRVRPGGIVRNDRAWTAEEWGYVAPRCRHLEPNGRCGVHGHPCPYTGHCADREMPGLRVQRDNPPVFNLLRLRAEAGNE